MPDIDKEKLTVQFNSVAELERFERLLDSADETTMKDVYTSLRRQCAEFDGYRPSYMRNRLRRRIEFLESRPFGKGAQFKEEEVLALKWCLACMAAQTAAIFRLRRIALDVADGKMTPSEARKALAGSLAPAGV